MTTLQKIIHAQVTKGQISITEKTGGEKGAWYLQGGERYQRRQCPPAGQRWRALQEARRLGGRLRAAVPPFPDGCGAGGARGCCLGPGGQVWGPCGSALLGPLGKLTPSQARTNGVPKEREQMF